MVRVIDPGFWPKSHSCNIPCNTEAAPDFFYDCGYQQSALSFSLFLFINNFHINFILYDLIIYSLIELILVSNILLNMHKCV